MHVAVLVAGVADPKWPLPRDITLASLEAHGAAHAALSPFDEAALEIALKLRDADASVRITALVAGDEAFARRIAGWRPDAIHRIEIVNASRFDGLACGRALAEALRSLAPDASLVLMGREFGDFDDGTACAALAHAAVLDHVALVLALERRGDDLWAVRQGSDGLERVKLPARALLSATNDLGNRLRHPLMKNVMMAKKAAIASWKAPEADDARASGLHLDKVQAAPEPQRRTESEWLQGTPRQKADALAQMLRSASQS